MFTRTEEEKKLFADFLRRLDRAFLKMQYEENMRVLKQVVKSVFVLSPDEIDEKVRFCMKFHGRSGGKRLFYTRLLVLARSKGIEKGGSYGLLQLCRNRRD